jgi:hypothetical protein
MQSKPEHKPLTTGKESGKLNGFLSLENLNFFFRIKNPNRVTGRQVFHGTFPTQLQKKNFSVTTKAYI